MKVKKSYLPLILKSFLGITILGLLLLAYVGIKVKITENQHEGIKLEEQYDALSNENRHLSAEYQDLASRQNITDIASQNLGMVRASANPIVIEIKKEDIIKLNETLEKK